MNNHETKQRPQNRHNTTLWVFIAIISYFLIMEHWAHIVPYLPWLFLLVCPLMHVFMHGGHGHGGHNNHDKQISHSDRDREGH
jgi:DUF2933 family protein